MVSLFGQNGFSKECILISRELMRTEFALSEYSFIWICLWTGPGNWNQGNMFEADVFVGSQLVDFYAKYDRLEDAHHCFDEINEKNFVFLEHFDAQFFK